MSIGPSSLKSFLFPFVNNNGPSSSYFSHYSSMSSIYGFAYIRFYFIKGGGYHCTGVRFADEPCRPAVQAKRETEKKKPPEAKVGLESL